MGWEMLLSILFHSTRCSVERWHAKLQYKPEGTDYCAADVAYSKIDIPCIRKSTIVFVTTYVGYVLSLNKRSNLETVLS